MLLLASIKQSVRAVCVSQGSTLTLSKREHKRSRI